MLPLKVPRSCLSLTRICSLYIPSLKLLYPMHARQY
uniref:Uncharacterized protein n=1 Tax=Rhizophora mucronata TaxID=61149 RepID=A0A2P2Q3U9_RHIMU